MPQSTSDLLKTSTAEFKVLFSTNGNGHVHERAHANGGNGHRRRIRRQLQHGYRRAVLRADTAVTLVAITGMPVAEAIARCGTSTDYYYAIKAVKESGNTALYDAVLKDKTPLFPAAASVKNAAAVITAYENCTELEKALIFVATGATANAVTLLRGLCPEHLLEVANQLGTDWVWDNMITPAMSTKSAESMSGMKATVT